MMSPRSFRLPHPFVGSGHTERGSGSIQNVILLPLVFSVMFLGLQGALHYHARTVAIAAAQDGARAAGAEGGTGGDGSAAASSFVADAGGSDVIRGVRITSQRSATNATVTVTGRPLTVIPGWGLMVRQSATVPVERVTG